MTDYAAHQQELTDRQVEDFKRDVTWRQEKRDCKTLIKQIKAELPQATARQKQAGWPNATQEQAWGAPGLFGLKWRQVGLVSVWGDASMSYPLRFNDAGYGHWLGTDGRLYKPNHVMWTSPQLNPPPFEQVDWNFLGYRKDLEKILAGLRAL